jgi:hypothetical protein
MQPPHHEPGTGSLPQIGQYRHHTYSTYSDTITGLELWWETLKERDHLEGLGVNGRTIFKAVDVELINRLGVQDKWGGGAPVNTVTNPRVP